MTKKIFEKPGKVNFNNIFYLTQNVQNLLFIPVINIKITSERVFTCVHTKYVKSSVHFTLTAPLPWVSHSSRVPWLLAILLDSPGLDQQSAFFWGPLFYRYNVFITSQLLHWQGRMENEETIL